MIKQYQRNKLSFGLLDKEKIVQGNITTIECRPSWTEVYTSTGEMNRPREKSSLWGMLRDEKNVESYIVSEECRPSY